MAGQVETLEVQVIRRSNGAMSGWHRIAAAFDDTSTLLKHLEMLAREWGGEPPGTRWLDRYELRVRSISEPWRREITVTGIAGDR